MNTAEKQITNRELFSVTVGSFVAITAASIPAVIMASNFSTSKDTGFEELLINHPSLFIMALCCTQLGLFFMLAHSAYRSPLSVRESLSIQAVHLSLPRWSLIICASIGASSLSSFFIHENEYMNQFVDIFASHPLGFGLCVLVLGSVLPGLSEELLCRGYLQRRLLKRWHPVAAIYVSSMFFAALHMDATHAMAVLPLGLWLGFLHYHTKSIVPSIVCHIANNAFAFSILLFNAKVAPIPDTATNGFSIFFLLALILGAHTLIQERKQKPSTEDR